MLAPQFSIRWLFGLTAMIAVLALVTSFAYQGSAWAIATAGAIGGLALSFMAFVGAWVAGVVVAGIVHAVRPKKPVAESPFAMHKAAPQVIEPRESES